MMVHHARNTAVSKFRFRSNGTTRAFAFRRDLAFSIIFIWRNTFRNNRAAVIRGGRAEVVLSARAAADIVHTRRVREYTKLPVNNIILLPLYTLIVFIFSSTIALNCLIENVYNLAWPSDEPCTRIRRTQRIT